MIDILVRIRDLWWVRVFLFQCYRECCGLFFFPAAQYYSFEKLTPSCASLGLTIKSLAYDQPGCTQASLSAFRLTDNFLFCLQTSPVQDQLSQTPWSEQTLFEHRTFRLLLTGQDAGWLQTYCSTPVWRIWRLVTRQHTSHYAASPSDAICGWQTACCWSVVVFPDCNHIFFNVCHEFVSAETQPEYVSIFVSEYCWINRLIRHSFYRTMVCFCVFTYLFLPLIVSGNPDAAVPFMKLTFKQAESQWWLMIQS